MAHNLLYICAQQLEQNKHDCDILFSLVRAVTTAVDITRGEGGDIFSKNIGLNGILFICYKSHNSFVYVL